MSQVPLSLWAAWGIYSQPIRYRSLFPHNEARKQAIAGTLYINLQKSYTLFFKRLTPYSSLLHTIFQHLGERQNPSHHRRNLRLPLCSIVSW